MKRCDHIWRIYLNGDKVKTCVKCWKEVNIKLNKQIINEMYNLALDKAVKQI